ncbi:MAG TPA: PH domain-containing protein [Phycisphaerae bacterium]|nr:PH domain-containing protein [Phycisphaerae bacterium]
MTSVPRHSKRWQSIPHHRTEETPALPRNLVAAVVPEQILHDDEIVLILTKPSLWFILFTSFRFVLTFVLLGILAERVMPTYTNTSPQAIALVTVLICMGRLVWALLVWTSHIYMLTNQRVVTIKGVINVRMFQAHLRKIQRTTLFQPLPLRLVSTGTIGFATAATTDFDSTWVMIARPLETHENIVAAINKAQ